MPQSPGVRRASQPVPRGCTQARGRRGALGFHQVPSRLARPLRRLEMERPWKPEV